jgi:hypothetical protein
MAKQITIQPPPDMTGNPSPFFKKESFDAAVWAKGYLVLIESAIKCPCKTKNNSHLSTCPNCLGTGWFFINPTEDRATINSINFETTVKEWSTEKIGTVNITLMKRSALSYMDRITILNCLIVSDSEIRYPFFLNGQYIAYTTYDIKGIESVFRFNSPTTPLIRLIENVDFTHERNKIIFNIANVTTLADLKAIATHLTDDKKILNSAALYIYSETSVVVPDDILVVKPNNVTLSTPGRWLKLDDFTISIRYIHKLQYHVIDLPHLVRDSYRIGADGKEEFQILPVNCIARLSHYVIDALNFAGDNVYDNSYTETE